ncbi:MAG TPA: phenylalanine--tRNA ligase subunit beta [Hyphomonadaceae bacterium]|jgi:phenylalanyl-tRNA synthetase beta chain|nr:phenylalanine--tRNA ligase subunit beta [Hyphomonadaceae bacterium]
MKFTLPWLKDYLDTKAELPAILDAMTQAGLEVEDAHDPRDALKQFTVAKIVSAKQHPNADKLQVCQVETVDGMKEIVCGGINARPGLVTSYAPIGAFIPGSGITLAPKPVRGVISNGMLCSGSEMQTDEDPFRLRIARFEDWQPRAQALGLSDEQAIADGGIIELPDDLKVGSPVADALALDTVVDFEVTPNRPDWLGVTGIARDLAAKGVGTFKLPKVEPTAGKFKSPVTVTIDAPEACPVFAGRLIRGVKNKQSPEWLQKRLKAIGINPKTMLVDVTNYISFDRARPLHVYDAKLLKGGIRVRLGTASDKFEALDGKTYENLSEMCVIADDSGAIGLGGVMGGASTGCSVDTTDVFLESAWFDPNRTAKTGRTTGIISDARFRFERGVDPHSCVDGIELATKLILEVCGGDASEVVIAGKVPEGPKPVTFKTADMKRLTGVDMKPARMAEILTALGFETTAKGGGDAWPWKVPSWRPDVEGSADIVEELIRIEGFDKLPEDRLPAPEGPARVVVTPLQNRVRVARRVLAGRGFLETVTWSFMFHEKAALMIGGANKLADALTIDNPIASDLDYMRPSMLANLAEAAQKNADHGADDVRLFEAGPVYPGDAPADQRMMVAGVVKASKTRGWQGPGAGYDAFAAKADLFAVLGALDQPGERFQVGAADGPYWHPGRAGTLRLGPKQVVASFGELHPAFLKALDIEGPVLAFEIGLDALPAAKAKATKTKARFEKADQTPVKRDFAFVVEEKVPAGDIVRMALKADPKLVVAASVFDVFRGPSIGEGKKSVAIEVTLQPRGAAMTDVEIEAVASAIVKSVGKATGATLRG